MDEKNALGPLALRKIFQTDFRKWSKGHSALRAATTECQVFNAD